MRKASDGGFGWSFSGWPERFPRTSMRIETRAARRMRHVVEQRAANWPAWPKEGDPLPPELWMRPTRQWVRAQLREDDKANPKLIRFRPTWSLSKAAVAALERRAKRKARKAGLKLKEPRIHYLDAQLPYIEPKPPRRRWKDGPSGRVPA